MHYMQLLPSRRARAFTTRSIVAAVTVQALPYADRLVC